MRKTAAVLALFICVQSFGQSNNFNLGKNLEIQYSILRELGASYVDSIDYEKIMPVGIEAMLQTLDPYTTYIPEEDEENLEMLTTGTYGGIGAIITKRVGGGVVISQPYPNSPAVKYGLEPGDTIWEIDGNSVKDLTSDESSSRMKGQPGTEVRFKVEKGRTGDTVDVTVIRERIHVSSIEYSGIIRDSIGYVLISGFTDNMSQELRTAVLDLKDKGMKRLVIDLRDNGGGVMDEAVTMASLFVPKGTLVVSSRGRNESMNNEYYTTLDPIDTEIPLLVMVNSTTASASEIFSGAMQDLDRGVVAGRRTYGKGLIQSIRQTPYNGKVKLTTGKYYTPSGRCVQAVDYSHRNEDGSVGFIPDSLKKEFKTVSGRSVYDGGGITPDIEVESKVYSRPAYAVAYGNLTGLYALEYYKKHESIAPAADFHLTDAEYSEFAEFAAAQDFDIRSSAETALDALVKAAKQDGLYDQYKAEIDALSSRIKLDKKQLLELKRDEIRPLVEEEIVSRYYFESAGNVILLRHDEQLDAALDKWDGFSFAVEQKQ